MASCSLGASYIKAPSLCLYDTRVGSRNNLKCLIPLVGKRPLQYGGLAISQQSVPVFRAMSLETSTGADLKGDSKETKPSGLTSQLIPNSDEVNTLVTEICDSTSVAEFELKLGGFRLYVKREISEEAGPTLPSSRAPVSVYAATNGAVSTSHSLAISTTSASLAGIEPLLDRAADEGLMILQSPKVGFFRRCKTIKGKNAPPPCVEKQTVREGQVLCYIEQLGAQIPIESDVAGEVVKVLRKDGDPVGFNDPLIAILPSFPGIKKLR